MATRRGPESRVDLASKERESRECLDHKEAKSPSAYQLAATRRISPRALHEFRSTA